MQARKNKYQRDKRGYIIEEIKEKDNNKGKGKMNEYTVVSNNKFRALQVEEEAEPIMQIKDGDVHDQNSKENIKEKVQENNSNTRGTSPNPTDNGIGKGMMYKEGGKVSLNKEDFDARKLKKEAVEMVNKVRESGNISSATRNDAEAKKEQTIDWKEDTNEVNSVRIVWSDEIEVMENQKSKEHGIESNAKENNDGQISGVMEDATVNPSDCQIRFEDKSSYMEKQVEIQAGKDQGVTKGVGKQGTSAQQVVNEEKANGTVNPSKTGEILAFVDGVPIYSVEKEPAGDVSNEVLKDTGCLEDESVHGKGVDHNAIVKPGGSATVNPNLGSVYELQFKMMKEKLGDMEKISNAQQVALTPYESAEQAIVARDQGELDSLPVACASGTGSPMQIQVNMPLRTPNQAPTRILPKRAASNVSR
ncbi:hypothetical protein A4A49_24368 [Nicotiana attenuata]|uniref:Uncharacterized protein n=1 Tax=Nicotiana attenuata TaxID=49451 RepID=A0A1J6KUU1_NICAT|nr:hypothetical protein A4A49_24368 [Nicotiana attenuata]